MSPRRVWDSGPPRALPRELSENHGPELLEMYAHHDIGLLGASFDLLQNAVRVRLEDAIDARPSSPRARTLVPNLRPSSAAVLLLLASFLSGVALLACYLPARKSSRVDPMAVLRLD